MNIQDFFKIVGNSLYTGSRDLSGNFSGHAFRFEYWNQSHGNKSVIISVLVDVITHTVFEMEVLDGKNNREYLWIDPAYATSNTRPSRSGRNFIQVEVEEDILEKGQAIFNGQDYDSRLIVPVDMSEELLFEAMKQAHKLDITLNRYIESLLTNFVEQQKSKK